MGLQTISMYGGCPFWAGTQTSCLKGRTIVLCATGKTGYAVGKQHDACFWIIMLPGHLSSLFHASFPPISPYILKATALWGNEREYGLCEISGSADLFCKVLIAEQLDSPPQSDTNTHTHICTARPHCPNPQSTPSPAHVWANRNLIGISFQQICLSFNFRLNMISREEKAGHASSYPCKLLQRQVIVFVSVKQLQYSACSARTKTNRFLQLDV